MPSKYVGKPKTIAEEVAARRAAAGLPSEKDSGPKLPAPVVELGRASFRRAFRVLGLDTPEHYGALLDRLQAVADGKFSPESPPRIALTSAPQHGKSTVILVFLLWTMARAETGRSPNGREILLFATYAAGLTKKQKAEADRLAERVSFPFTVNNSEEWRTEKGNFVHWTSISGTVNGVGGVTCAIVDDPYSGPEDANSPAVREQVQTWFHTSLRSRVLTKPCILTSIRWHEDDLFAPISKDPDWEFFQYPAISKNEAGEEVALWQDRMPLAALERERRSLPASKWSCLWMCEPMKPEANRFRGSPALYKTRHRLPGVAGSGDQYANVSIGCDLAYSGKGDYCAVVVLGYLREEIHLLHFERKLCNVADFGPVLRDVQAKFSSRVRIHAGPNDRVALDLEALQGIRFEVLDAAHSGNKAIRSEPAAHAWNCERLMFPADPLPDQAYFISECTDFTGDGRGHDDLVDALSTAFSGVKPKIRSWSWMQERLF